MTEIAGPAVATRRETEATHAEQESVTHKQAPRVKDTLVILIAGKDPLEEVSGGHSQYVRAHAWAVKAMGIQPHLFCVSRTNDEESTDMEYGTLHRVRFPLPRRQITIMFQAPLLVRAMDRFVGNIDATVCLHSFGVWSYAGAMAAARLNDRGVRVKHVASAYTTYEVEARAYIEALSADYSMAQQLRFRLHHLWSRWVVSRYERIGYSDARFVAINYESVRRQFSSVYGELSERLYKVPYSVPLAFERHELSSSRPSSTVGDDMEQNNLPLILCIARQMPKKGVMTLLFAFEEMVKRGIAFRATIVGGGKLYEENRRWAKSAGIGNIVRVTGPVESVDPYLRAADIFVLPSEREESGSLALLEAMRAGLGIVATNVDGIPEDVVDGLEALLVEPRDPLTLCDALCRLVDNAALRHQLGNAARERFKRDFSPDRFTQALVTLYRDAGVWG